MMPEDDTDNYFRAGLTGLSAAYHLRDGYEIFEQESEVGGLCRTMEREAFSSIIPAIYYTCVMTIPNT